jgi:hypothetical protein
MADRYVEYVRLDNVQLAESNPKEHDEAGIAASLDDFGIGELPLIDERTGRLVAGHGRYRQLVRLAADGRRRPAGVNAAEDGTWLMPLIRGWKSRSDEHAKAYLLASNKLTENGGWNDRALYAMLQDVNEAELLNLTGFGDEDLDNLDALLDVNAWDPPAMKKAKSSSSSDRDDDGQDDDEDDVTPLGRGVDDSDMWPKIEIKVSPDVFDAWRLLLEAFDGKDDAAKVHGLLVERGLLL